MLWRIRSLRRIWYALPFAAVVIVGLGSLFSIFYEEEFGLNSAQRGFAAAVTEPAQILGLVAGIPIANRLLRKDPALVLRFIAIVGVVVAACFATLSVTPYLAVVILMNMVIAAAAAVLSPGVYSVLSLALPPRARSLGFAVSALWILPGLALYPLIGHIADTEGIRTALLGLWRRRSSWPASCSPPPAGSSTTTSSGPAPPPGSPPRPGWPRRTAASPMPGLARSRPPSGIIVRGGTGRPRREPGTPRPGGRRARLAPSRRARSGLRALAQPGAVIAGAGGGGHPPGPGACCRAPDPDSAAAGKSGGGSSGFTVIDPTSPKKRAPRPTPAGASGRDDPGNGRLCCSRRRTGGGRVPPAGHDGDHRAGRPRPPRRRYCRAPPAIRPRAVWRYPPGSPRRAWPRRRRTAARRGPV